MSARYLSINNAYLEQSDLLVALFLTAVTLSTIFYLYLSSHYSCSFIIENVKAKLECLNFLRNYIRFYFYESKSLHMLILK